MRGLLELGRSLLRKRTHSYIEGGKMAEGIV